MLDGPRGTAGFGYDPLFYYPPFGLHVWRNFRRAEIYRKPSRTSPPGHVACIARDALAGLLNQAARPLAFTRAAPKCSDVFAITCGAATVRERSL